MQALIQLQWSLKSDPIDEKLGLGNGRCGLEWLGHGSPFISTQPVSRAIGSSSVLTYELVVGLAAKRPLHPWLAPYQDPMGTRSDKEYPYTQVTKSTE